MVRSALLTKLRENGEICALLRALHEWKQAGYALLAGNSVETEQHPWIDEMESSCLLDVAVLTLCAASKQASIVWAQHVAGQSIEAYVRPMRGIV